MRARHGVLVSLAIALAAPLAHAQLTAREKADALFREGRAASQVGDYATACAKFEGSQALDPSIGTQLNLGDCSDHLGKWVAARGYFRDAIIKLDPSDARVVQARERLKVLEARMPKLTVTLGASAPPGTVVRCDGRTVPDADLGSAVPTDPGAHVCVASAQGYADRTQTVTALEGAQARLEVSPGDRGAENSSQTASKIAPPPIDGATASSSSSASTKRTIGWVIGGVGVAGLALAGVSGLVLLGEKSTADSGCQNKTSCNADALSAISANKTWLPVNTVAWIVGAVGIGAGAFLILTSKDGALAARVGATVLPGGAAASAVVTFE